MISLSDRPAPAALTLGQGYFVNATGKLYIGIDDPHTSAAPDGDFTAQTTRTDLHFVDHLPTNLNNLTVGDFWFQRPIQEFYKLVQRAGVRNLEQKHAEAGLAGDQTDTSRPVVFLGFVATDAEALRFTVAIFTGNDYFYIDSDTDEVKLLDNSTFTAPGQTAHIIINLRRLAAVEAEAPQTRTITPIAPRLPSARAGAEPDARQNRLTCRPDRERDAASGRRNQRHEGRHGPAQRGGRCRCR